MRSLLLTSLALCAFAFQPFAVARATTTNGSLTAALDSVSADKIRADIFFIASDELEGRDTVSAGQRIAARYIRSRLERLGIKPGAQNGYLFEYPLTTSRLDDKASYARWSAGGATTDFALGRDYFVASRNVQDLTREGKVVFCGEGKKSQIDGAGLKGKWALVLDDGGLVGDLEKVLLEQGALGALMTPAANYSGKPYADRFSRDTRVLTKGSAQWPREKDKAEEQGGVFLWLTPSTAQAMLPALAGKSLPTVGTELEGNFAHARKLMGDAGMIHAENVCGFWPGNDPALASEVIIVSAHYDHVGYGGTNEIHNGADDNGSGTCGMMALAEALTVNGPMRRSVMLMWVSGEEKGLWGSQAWTQHPWLPEGCKPIADINIDMIGRNAPDKLLITPTSARKEYNGLVRVAEKVSPLEGFPKLGSCDEYWSRSDHANFASNLKIPVTFLFSDIHEDYHKPTDDPEKIDCDKIRRVTRTVLRMIAELQDDKLDL